MKRTFLAALGVTAALVLADGGVALADNSASDSVGAVQVASTTVSPTVTVGDTSASAPASVGGGGDNTANGSTGAVQAGGGNSANRSTGSVQVGESRVAGSASGQSAGEAAGVSTSLGTSGGNSANGSTGAVQVGGTQGTATGASSGPAGVQSLTVPFGVGAGGGNSADGSTGTVQLGGGSDGGSTTAAGLTGTPFADVSASRDGRLATQPAGRRSGLGGQGVAGQGVAGPSVLGAVSRPVLRALGQVVSGGVLPFTGRSLLLWSVLGLAAGLLGLGGRLKAAI
jgi:hypothetical protein